MTTSPVLPPVALSTERLWATGIGSLALVIAFAGDGIRNLVTIWGFGALSIVVALACVLMIIRVRPRLDRSRLPKALIAFLSFALLSAAWSAYPQATLLTLAGTLLTTIVGVYLALVLDWTELVRALANALKWVLGLSLLFELWVALIVRAPVLPLFVDFGDEKPPLLAMWSRNLLFEGGRIQGILGNSNLLAVIALLGIITFGLQLAAGSVRRGWGIAWLALALVIFSLTRSSTMIVAALAAAIVLGAVLLIRRSPSPRARAGVYVGLAALGAAAIAFVALFSNLALALLGKSEDLTGRLTIWKTVIGLAEERPWIGWGYSSPWIPWAEPFDGLIIRRGVEQLHAHNAWLDVWLQLGVVGVALFTAVIVSVLWRSWFAAVDRPRFDLRDDRPYTVLSLLPILITVVLVVQSVAESRILIESGWVLIVALALKTKQHPVMDAVARAHLTPVIAAETR
ncbi:O-antigen ligase family protein [Mycetocola zhujimingii]|uniref:Exopolysaccharide production protein n=1 Tax=Mycetocola zhujimingii TaxID=2079792 RepID=A0A2U1TEW4_9MICO|nr:O-antigen ligase family protein [Mycetocola zhujimingii]PWC07422.1 exopolysaccharide production protein [Mycetocola zhujimingii]